ncbi:MAG TPA: glycoside hydrolase family 16 protein [Trebonia sp.]
MIAACAAVALVVAGGVYQLTKKPVPVAHVQAAGKSAPATAKSQASPAGTAASPATDGPPASLGNNWKQTFNATFAGSALDTSVWGTCYPWESSSGCANFGNSDIEYQWYTPTQDQVRDGALQLVAEKASTDDDGKAYNYQSGLVTTFPSYKFQYGYIEIDARVPSATGLWSALWLAAANEQWPPEIDILEHWDAQKQYWEYYHPANAPREDTSTPASDVTGWHEFGLYWDQSEVVWYVDGRQVYRAVRNVPQQPMYFLANVAVDEPGVALTGNSSLDIKSVKVWQHG